MVVFLSEEETCLNFLKIRKFVNIATVKKRKEQSPSVNSCGKLTFRQLIILPAHHTPGKLLFQNNLKPHTFESIEARKIRIQPLAFRRNDLVLVIFAGARQP